MILLKWLLVIKYSNKISKIVITNKKPIKILIYLILSTLKIFNKVEELSDINPLFISSVWRFDVDEVESVVGSAIVDGALLFIFKGLGFSKLLLLFIFNNLLFFFLKFCSIWYFSSRFLQNLLILIFINDSVILLAEYLSPFGLNFSKATSEPYIGKSKTKFLISK